MEITVTLLHFGGTCEIYRGFPGGLVKNPLTNAGDVRDVGLISGSGKAPGVGNVNPLQYSCLEKFHGQRSLAGYIQSMGLQRVRHDLVSKQQ